MAIPKRKRKTVNIDNRIFEYAVTSKTNGIRIFIRETENSNNQAYIVIESEYWDYIPELGNVSITPSHIRRIIRKKGMI